MRGRGRFNGGELAWIRQQLIQLRIAEREEQKRIRGRLRRAEFRISDWATDGRGFTASEFDTLIARGAINRDDSVGIIPAGPDPMDVDVPGGPLDTWAEAMLPGALGALAGSQASRYDVPSLIATAGARREPGSLLDSPGLYAMYAEPAAWQQLGLGRPPDDRPLYVGKAEESLVTRDLLTHFATGRTGQSSPRRSYAALLVADLALVAIPRRPADPESDKWTHYALVDDGDERLTQWMCDELRLAVWPCKAPMALGKLERLVLRELKPALNLTGVSQPWSRQVRQARAAMALTAEKRSPRSG